MWGTAGLDLAQGPRGKGWATALAGKSLWLDGGVLELGGGHLWETQGGLP